MVDRRALIVGGWQAIGREKPTPQRIRSIVNRWSKIFEADDFEFRSLTDKRQKPVPLLNPTRRELLGELIEPHRVSEDTELLIHFVGHSVSLGADDLELILRVGEDDEQTTLPLSQLLENIARIRAGTIILVLDTCHSGRTHTLMTNFRDRLYAMCATGDRWAYNAKFSDLFLDSIERPLARRGEQRFSGRYGGVTYAKLFEDVLRRFNDKLEGVDNEEEIASPMQTPVAYGDAGNRVFIRVPPMVTAAFSPLARAGSIYARTYALLVLIDENEGQRLMPAVQSNRNFIIEADAERTVSTERISDYLAFLQRAGWIARPTGGPRLTTTGREALDRQKFNRILLAAIEQRVLPAGFGLVELEAVVRGLLEDMIPPTPSRIRERALMKNIRLKLDAPTRVALALLPATGQFLKGAADAIFPYEQVGDD